MDSVLIVQALGAGEVLLDRVARSLVLALDCDAEPVVVLTKADRCDAGELERDLDRVRRLVGKTLADYCRELSGWFKTLKSDSASLADKLWTLAAAFEPFVPGLDLFRAQAKQTDFLGAAPDNQSTGFVSTLPTQQATTDIKLKDNGGGGGNKPKRTQKDPAEEALKRKRAELERLNQGFVEGSKEAEMCAFSHAASQIRQLLCSVRRWFQSPLCATACPVQPSQHRCIRFFHSNTQTLLQRLTGSGWHFLTIPATLSSVFPATLELSVQILPPQPSSVSAR